MNSNEVRLKQFKLTSKGLWKLWHEALFFEVLLVFDKVHEAPCKKKTGEVTCKNSRNFRKVSVFSFKKASSQSKNRCCAANFWEDGPKEIGAKVAGKGFFNSWGNG